MNLNIIKEYNDTFKNSNAQDILQYFIEKFKDKIVFSTSLGAEDQVVTKMIADIDKSTAICMLDTGRHFEDTYEVFEKTNARYGVDIQVFFPDYNDVEEMVNHKGVNLFYDSIENRKQCCGIRKIKPLKRALKPYDYWITGLRSDQAVTRKDLSKVEWDDHFEILKINPIIDWSESDVWDYIKKHQIPYNKLHDKGYPSIGCEPCTRAIEKGEDVRAGRWWWENPETKECGLHKK